MNNTKNKELEQVIETIESLFNSNLKFPVNYSNMTSREKEIADLACYLYETLRYTKRQLAKFLGRELDIKQLEKGLE